MTKSHVLGYFVIVALLISGLVGLGGGGTSEAAPLLGFTDTPPAATEPPPPLGQVRRGHVLDWLPFDKRESLCYNFAAPEQGVVSRTKLPGGST